MGVGAKVQELTVLNPNSWYLERDEQKDRSWDAQARCQKLLPPYPNHAALPRVTGRGQPGYQVLLSWPAAQGTFTWRNHLGANLLLCHSCWDPVSMKDRDPRSEQARPGIEREQHTVFLSYHQSSWRFLKPNSIKKICNEWTLFQPWHRFHKHNLAGLPCRNLKLKN